ncbi:aKG-HExxH-type peptide beta-hydroxylase [Solemya pervernicosa gill symbiont]|nr:HEXXH motif-containing putative peptide modification protein [Solemya pervernicosa gill symbiont]
MTIHFSFLPDPIRARAIDSRMRQGLADSLNYVSGELGKQVGKSLDGVDELVAATSRGAVYPPSTFGLYYEIVSAVMEDGHQAAETLINELQSERKLDGNELNVTTLGGIESISVQKRYQRLMDTDPNTPFTILSPAGEEADDLVSQFKSGHRRLRETIPVLADEFESLVKEVVLVVGDVESNGYDFAGGSSYMLWGALFINAERHKSDVALIEAIAHESAHSFLFGMTYDEPLVLNADDELLQSPLRDDPRPMDGIYHATFVLARMHWAMSAYSGRRRHKRSR